MPASSKSKAIIHTDGASLGNPGPGGIGAVIEFAGQRVEVCEHIGVATNNVAEYTALVRALEEARRMGATALHVYMDSELIVRQVDGPYKVKNEGLMPLFKRVKELLGAFKSYRIEHIPRERNTEADKLSKQGAENPQLVQKASGNQNAAYRQEELF